MQQNVFQIFTGDDKVLSLKAIKANNGDPLDLTGATEIVLALPKADGSLLRLKLSDEQIEIVDSPVLGKIAATITADDSALLNPGVLQSFNVTYTIGAEIVTVAYKNCFSVYERDIEVVEV
jgi:hypothetical protein